jgi:TfoX/Sxy family transcriptional regulator of competence genes
MAYDEGLAQRLREQLADHFGLQERKMFGGLAFMHRGHMLVGITGEVLMARVGPDHHAAALKRAHARPMDFTGKPMKGYVFVDPAGFSTDANLARWIALCLEFNATLPAK